MKNKITLLFNTEDKKRLLSNFISLSALQIAGYVFPLLTIPYLARVIGVEGFGKIAFASAVIIWFQTISDWGFNYTATRDVAQNRDNPENVSEVFSNVLWARLLLMILSLILLLVAIALIPYFDENRIILLVTFLLVPGHIMFPEWFFQAMERMKYITIFNLLSKALFTVLVFVFINEKQDFILQPLFISLGYIVSGTIAMYLILVRWKIKLLSPKLKAIIDTIKGSSNVFISNIMPNLYYGFSTLLVGFFCGSVSNGVLDAGRKFVGISDQFLNVLSRVFYPFLARNRDQHSFYVKVNLCSAIFFFLILFVSAPWIIRIFFTQEFYSAIYVLQISSLSLVFLSLRNIYGINFLILRGYDHISRDIIVKTSVFGFFIAIPLVYFFDYIGAAIVAVFIHALQGLWMLHAANQIQKRNSEISCN